MEEVRIRARIERTFVESRTRLAIGGMATVAASVAVVCVVAMTSNAAMADVTGAPTGSRPVVLPSAPVPSVPAPSASAVPPAAQAPAPVEPETVPAPEPYDVTAPPSSSVAADDPSAATEEQLLAEALATGTWDGVRAWAVERGWDSARVDAWIAKLQVRLAERGDLPGGLTLPDSSPSARTGSQSPALAGAASGRDLSGSSLGSKREQSRVPPG